MSNIDKQAVQAVADLKAGYTLGHADVAILNELARIALASLEAEPVALRDERSGSGGISKQPGFNGLPHGTPLYTSQPASINAEPVAWLWSHRKHPSEVTLVRPEDDDKAEAAQWSGWSYKALYTDPPEPVAPEKRTPRDMELLLEETGAEVSDHDLERVLTLMSTAWNECRAAMLQGAEPVTTAYKLPDDFDFDRFNDVVWLEAVASNPHMHSLTTSTIAMVALELNKRLNVANSPVIPDGWVMVPVEPTMEMLDEFDSIIDHGAEDSKEAWSRLIAAAPQQEVK
ncbi:hypothetical protein ACOTX5_23845 [Enterobacter cloacae complex sp. IR5441]|uniref:hypothetical protein n=1 Tax=Enterobacter cloacae complex TaxID=354276 RepID=UPI001F206D6B|nr:hypothetical protein [Enterobacter hormaechei]